MYVNYILPVESVTCYLCIGTLHLTLGYLVKQKTIENYY